MLAAADRACAVGGQLVLSRPRYYDVQRSLA